MELKTDWQLEKEDHALEHYGVLGMKWGVRRDRKRAQKDAILKLRQTKELTDDELKNRINRLNLEKQYRDLVTANTTPQRSATRKFITNILSTAGSQSLTKLTSASMDAGLKALAKELGGQTLVDALYPKEKPKVVKRK